MTSPSPSLPHSTALRRLKAAHDASRAADALKRGDRGKAAELYLSSAAATAPSCSFSTSAATATAAAASRARALSNASAALCAAGRFKEALEAAEEAIRLSSPEEEEEEEEEAGGERRGDAASPSLALCLSPPQQQRQRRKGRLGWSKPHWRRGAALRGLGEHLDAAMAFADAHRALESEAKGGGGSERLEGRAATRSRRRRPAAPSAPRRSARASSVGPAAPRTRPRCCATPCWPPPRSPGGFSLGLRSLEEEDEEEEGERRQRRACEPPPRPSSRAEAATATPEDATPRPKTPRPRQPTSPPSRGGSFFLLRSLSSSSSAPASSRQRGSGARPWRTRGGRWS